MEKHYEVVVFMLLMNRSKGQYVSQKLASLFFDACNACNFVYFPSEQLSKSVRINASTKLLFSFSRGTCCVVPGFSKLQLAKLRIWEKLASKYPVLCKPCQPVPYHYKTQASIAR